MSNIAILGTDFIQWGGGTEFLRLCINSLMVKSREHNLKIILVLPNKKNNHIHKLKNFIRPYKYMAIDLLNFKKPFYRDLQPLATDTAIDTLRNVYSELDIIFYDGLPHLISCLKQIDATAVLPAATSLGVSFPIPWIGYIYDFQHRYYPHFFLQKEREYRDQLFSTMLSEAKAVIVNSVAVKHDISKFYPDSSCRVFSLPVSAAPVDNWFNPPDEDLTEKYHLPERYFIISNQFWVHKSHITAFEALSKLQKLPNMKDIHIVCTGKTHDYRFSNHFGELADKIKELALEKKIHFLGHIPKKDQINILCKSIAVLQPTLFEGGPGGGAVYDAIAMGVPAIVSDISINLEIEEDNIFFFKTASSDNMAEKMAEILNKEINRPVKSELIARGLARTERFGEKLLEAINFVVN